MSITSNVESFTEAELNRASLAGINKYALQVAKEYPESTFGRELRKHFNWGYIDKLAADRREDNPDYPYYQTNWLGGGFTTSLAFRDLPLAYSQADAKNTNILIELFGIPEVVDIIPEEVVSAVETHGLTPTGDLDTDNDEKAGTEAQA